MSPEGIKLQGAPEAPTPPVCNEATVHPVAGLRSPFTLQNDCQAGNLRPGQHDPSSKSGRTDLGLTDVFTTAVLSL